jgi:hypothetical protein
MFAKLREIWLSPFDNMDGAKLFAVVGLVIVMVILWRFILGHIIYGVTGE